jgi:NADPH:quinone reductase-like Zn-dependent oxidoreductase/1-acyl-sn-glycerol-3-phosphate acyltransferase/acyl carrier protein/NADP-dependent 3-hydroxy acid dehydrogenase YdfG
LEQLRRLLMPGGILAMIEITRHPIWLDVIFGQTKGWWAFEDRELRPSHPLLESAQWQSQLEAAGFQNLWLSKEQCARGEAAQTVLVAGRPAEPLNDLQWLVLSDARGVGRRVAAALQTVGHHVIASEPMPVGPLLDSLSRSPAGIVHLWSLDAGDDFEQAQSAGVHSVLSLIKEILARPQLHDCPIWVVTAGATVLPDDVSDNIMQSPMLGFARTVMKERPELSIYLVDIGSNPGRLEIEGLVCELTDPNVEEEVALRGSHRFVRRLRQCALADLPLRTDISMFGPKEWRAEIGTRGSLGSLQVRELDPVPPAPNQIQIAIETASLNFRDIMLAMGGIPGLEAELSFGHQHLGSDCAGVVTAVGDTVSTFRPGDIVMGMAPGALASTSTTSSALVANKPKRLSLQEAASIPTVFLTAWYSLVHLARLGRNERVLIHAASGGVGLAAIQIARNVGAEIFATAGSEEKRDHLRSLGIAHVMDSRSLTFPEEIRDRTGGRGVDVVVNSLTGEAVDRGLASLAPYGRFVELGKLDIYSNRHLPLGRFRQNVAYFAVDLDRLCAERPELVGEMLQQIVKEFEAGRFKPLPRYDFKMSQLEDALRLMAQAKHVGKIVLSTNGERPRPDIAHRPHHVLRKEASYLVTGGVGGVGLEIAAYLASFHPGAIVLMGRSPPNSGAAARIGALRRRGARIEVIRGDVSRPTDIDAVLRRIQRDFPPLRGIFHCAMVLDDRPLEELDDESLYQVMAVKALGAWNLHQRVADWPLDHFVLFSSIVSLFGNPLQANYGAASAFLDALAHHRHLRGQTALSINWGVLGDSGYVAERPDLQQFLEQQGYLPLPINNAIELLGTLLNRSVPQLMAADIDWRRFADYSPRAATTPRLAHLIPARNVASTTTHNTMLKELVDAGPAERAVLVESFLRKAVGMVLGISPDNVEVDRSFSELGVDSLLAVELMTILNREFELEIPAIALLGEMTTKKLAAVVNSKLNNSEDGIAPTTRADRSVSTAGRSEIERKSPTTTAATPAANRKDGATGLPVSSERQRQLKRTRVQTRRNSLLTDYASLDYTCWSVTQTLARAISRAGFGCIGKVNVEGLDNLPRSSPFILAVNHLSMADVPLALTIIPRRTIILATERLRPWWILDLFVRQIGQAIYVPNDGESFSALEQALQVLEHGGVIALAPEGVRSRLGLKRAQTGVAWLALKSGLPVVPYAAWGHERWRELLRRPKRMEIAIRIGEPISPPVAAASEPLLREYSDHVMIRIAQMLPSQYRGVYADSRPMA